MPFRLVAADLDGTLRAEGLPLSARVREAVRGALARGVHVVMATGRTYRTAVPFAQDLCLSGPIVCDHGATIRDVQSGQILSELKIPLDLTREAVMSAPSGSTVLACIGEEFYTAERTDDAVRFVGKFAEEHLHHVHDWDSFLSECPRKIVFVNDPVVTTQLLAEYSSRFGRMLQVVRSSPRYVELTHPDASKGNAVRWIADDWGISREEVIAVGDQGNDVSMIQWAGLGVAMGNATPEVQAAARWVTSSVDQDGVAELIEKFVLNSHGNENADPSRE